MSIMKYVRNGIVAAGLGMLSYGSSLEHQLYAADDPLEQPVKIDPHSFSTKTDIATLVNALGHDEVGFRSPAQWALLGKVGDVKTFKDAQKVGHQVIDEVYVAAQKRQLPISKNFIDEQHKYLDSLDAKDWVDHFLEVELPRTKGQTSNERKIVFLDRMIKPAFAGAAVLNEVLVPVGNAVMLYLQDSETEKLIQRGVLAREDMQITAEGRMVTKDNMVLVPEGEYIIGSFSAERQPFIEAMKKEGLWEGHIGHAAGEIAYETEGTRRKVKVGPIFIDITEKSNEQIKRFIDQTKYFPLNKIFVEDYYNNLSIEELIKQGKDRQADGGILKYGWKRSNRSYPKDQERLPFTFASLGLGQDYARFEGKRMPNNLEWECAARGIDARNWPGGNSFGQQIGFPKRSGEGRSWDNRYLTSENRSITTRFEGSQNRMVSLFVDVTPKREDQFFKGMSPLGAFHITGNAWEITTYALEDATVDNATREQQKKFILVYKGGGTNCNENTIGNFGRCAASHPYKADIMSASRATLRLVKDVSKNDIKSNQTK
ncbi:MAG: SUMF1/EgtB/PvdO family nonheme iron enzyme [Nanoarchaeota archaeon]|nr:SUMF1/EgtB/PvdO family nonheme iron enzyme [Nanoarchaeota archaeon]